MLQLFRLEWISELTEIPVAQGSRATEPLKKIEMRFSDGMNSFAGETVGRQADAIAKLLPVTGAWYVVDYNLCLHKLEAKDDKPERYFNSVYVNQIAKM